MQVIHSDVCGPFPTETFGCKRYFVSFIDDFSRHAQIFLLVTKDEVAAKLNDVLTHARIR